MSEDNQTEVKRGPGRPRSAAGLSVDEAHREGVVMGDDRDPNTEVKQARVRIPMNSGQKLSLRGVQLDTENYHYKWLYEGPDKMGVLVAAKDAFYEHVSDNSGAIMKAPSGGGFMYLMRLKMEYFREDQKASAEKRAAVRRRSNVVNKNEYTVDPKGRPIEDGEVIVSRKSSNNPYQ